MASGIAFLFIFLCGVYAQNFDILKNGISLGSGNPINAEIIWGDGNVFEVKMDGNAEKDYEWCWSVSLDLPCVNGTRYEPSLTVNPDSPQLYQIIVIGTSKTDNTAIITRQINLTFNPRPYIVTFNSDGGTPIPPPQILDKNEKAIKPADPIKTGHTFDSWYLKNPEEPFDFNTPITEDIVLSAKWKINEYDITWISDGSTIRIDKVQYGKKPISPPAPQKNSNLQYSYTFKGWMPEIAAVTGDIAYTAQFEEVAIEYPIILNGQGAAVNTAIVRAKYNEALGGALPEVSRAGYNFEGWFTAPAGGERYYATTPYTDINIEELYAQWSIINYSITYEPNGGTASDKYELTYNIETSVNLPDMILCGNNFDGWFDNPNFLGTPLLQVFTPAPNNLGNKTFHAKYREELPKPSRDLFIYAIPVNLTYNAKTITPISVTAKNEGQCPLEAKYIKDVFYNNSKDIPKNAGEYKVSVFIEKGGNYDSATVALGNFTIQKADVRGKIDFTEPIKAKDKSYDGTKDAVIEKHGFSGFYAGDIPKENIDYSVAASFNSPDAGTGIAVIGEIQWKQSGELAKNYELQNIPFNSTANIIMATSVLKIAPPENYEIYNKTKPAYIEKSNYIKDADIIWEYIKLPDGIYSNTLPNRIGDWKVRATLAATSNYTGAADSAVFFVARGDKPVDKDFILPDGISLDKNLSTDGKKYFVISPSHCNMEQASISLLINDEDEGIVLKIGKVPRDEINIGGIKGYELTFNKLDFGINSLIYELISSDNTYAEHDTILIEVPIPFDSIGAQKWNNVLYINNNYKTNGGYKWTEFEWYKNGTLAGSKQFYSAGSAANDTLKTSDVYYATMQNDNSRISTCEIKPKPVQTGQVEQAAKMKVLLEKSPADIEAYTIKGQRVTNTPAGVYWIK